MFFPYLVTELAEQVHATLVVFLELFLSFNHCSSLFGHTEFLEFGLGMLGSRSAFDSVSKLDELLAVIHGQLVDNRLLILEFPNQEPEERTGSHGITAFEIPSDHTAFLFASFALFLQSVGGLSLGLGDRHLNIG